MALHHQFETARALVYIILCILNALIIFMIYQVIFSFPNRCQFLPTKFRKCFLFNSENNNV